jgi:hypothetical protein
MGIDVGRLEHELVRMSEAGAQGKEFCEAIAELASRGRVQELQGILPTVVFEELSERYEQNPAVFVREWGELGREMQQGFVAHARQRLTSLRRPQREDIDNPEPAWKSVQRALDAGENELLRTAIALELVELIEPAAVRATHLRECVVGVECSEEAERYLDEATRCYFLGLFTACAVMCRSVLEEAVKRRLPVKFEGEIRRRYRNTATLGNLLHEVNNNLIMTRIDPGFPRLANMVNDTGRKAVHQGLLSEDEARGCLENARSALELLLRG